MSGYHSRSPGATQGAYYYPNDPQHSPGYNSNSQGAPHSPGYSTEPNRGLRGSSHAPGDHMNPSHDQRGSTDAPGYSTDPNRHRHGSAHAADYSTDSNRHRYGSAHAPNSAHYLSTPYSPNSGPPPMDRQKQYSYNTSNPHGTEAAVHMGGEPENQNKGRPPLKTEAEYRAWLDKEFRPMFAPYESKGGIPNEELLRYFQYESHGIPRHKLNNFLDKMDKNRDGRVSYKEFYEAMIRKRKEDLSKAQRFLLNAVLAASPTIKREERKKHHGDEVDGDKLDDEIPDSYLDAYNCRPPPIFIPLCCLLQIIFFAIYAVELNANTTEIWNHVTWTGGVPFRSSELRTALLQFSAPSNDDVIQSWIDSLSSPLLYDPAKRKEAWRFLSYMLIHVGYHHIIFNIVMQILLGIPLELVHKAWRVAPVFLAGVIAGSLASSIVDSSLKLAGASGGCYALIGAHFALVIMNWEELQHEWLNCRENPFRFLFSGVMRLIVLTLLLSFDFGVAIYKRYQSDVRERTSFSAHVGGLIAGLLVGIPVLKNLEKKPWEAYVFWLAIAISIILFLFAIFWNIFYTGFPTQVV